MKAKLDLKDKIEHCDWFGLDYNIKDVVEGKAGSGCGGYTEKTNARELEYDESRFRSFISELMDKYDAYFEDRELVLNRIDYKRGLEERFSELSNQKHVIQQSSLIGQLVESGCLMLGTHMLSLVVAVLSLADT
ncbi:unnamed protein product [Ambrosiozyma monospora]|uniref:Unnamed protein product n=1 Tax=Ambrosiozyma monospora TaxID=43982 RepID=A0ACB5U6T8_AMBMO|nr:unnamed protein product [Ambrosiozyma monospora]